MIKHRRMLLVLLLACSPNLALGEVLPHGAQIIASTDVASGAYISSAWPANDLQAVVTGWSERNRAAMEQEAQAIIVALDLQAEYRAINTLGVSTEAARQAAKRALARFLNDEMSYETVTPFEALIASELGRNPIGIGEINRVGIVNLPAGATSGLVRSIDGRVAARITNTAKVVAASGQYRFTLTINGAQCEKIFTIGAGQSDTLTCP